MSILNLNDIKLIPTFTKNFNPQIPDQCPICHSKITPGFVSAYVKDEDSLRIVFLCPNNVCNELFIGFYKKKFLFQGGTANFLEKCLPKIPRYKDIDVQIKTISPEFERIYNQATTAENIGLDDICGVGYRKAIEFLIKDYLVKLNPEKEDEIKKTFLGTCIKNYIANPKIQAIAERAVWIGNDETHYVRKWEDKDIKDLKMLIDITLHFILMELQFEKYMGEMSEGRK